MEHDDRCNVQDRDLTLLKEQSRTLNDTLREVVIRAQDLVSQYHAQNVKQAEMAGDIVHIKSTVDEIEDTLKNDYALRSEFAEIKGEWRKFLGLVLGAIVVAAVAFVLKGGLK